jgi:hypothetical protein
MVRCSPRFAPSTACRSEFSTSLSSGARSPDAPRRSGSLRWILPHPSQPLPVRLPRSGERRTSRCAASSWPPARITPANASSCLSWPVVIFSWPRNGPAYSDFISVACRPRCASRFRLEIMRPCDRPTDGWRTARLTAESLHLARRRLRYRLGQSFRIDRNQSHVPTAWQPWTRRERDGRRRAVALARAIPPAVSTHRA